jgi:hypothetical protein
VKVFEKTGLLLATFIVSSVLLQTACSSSGSGYRQPTVSYGAGYRGYHGNPYGGYRRPPVYVIDGGGGIDHGGGPVAAQLPDMGPPDMGGAGMDTMDMDFDW